VRGIGNLKAAEQQAVREGVFSSLIHFVENSISTEERLEILQSGNRDLVIQLLGDRLSGFTVEAAEELYQISDLSTKQKLEVIFIASIELIIYSIERDLLSRYPLLSYLNFPCFIFLDVFMKLSASLESNTGLSANLKFDIFKNRVEERNLTGWLVKKNGFGTTSSDREYRTDCVKIKDAYRREFIKFFDLNPEFLAESLFQIQTQCVLSGSTEKPDDGFDQYYHSRQAVDSLYLVSKLEKILVELELKEHFEDIVFESDPESD
jgi:hypothetical protein